MKIVDLALIHAAILYFPAVFLSWNSLLGRIPNKSYYVGYLISRNPHACVQKFLGCFFENLFKKSKGVFIISVSARVFHAEMTLMRLVIVERFRNLICRVNEFGDVNAIFSFQDISACLCFISAMTCSFYFTISWTVSVGISTWWFFFFVKNGLL